MPDKRINRYINENRSFGNEKYPCGSKFHKSNIRFNKGTVSGMAKEKRITNVEDVTGRLVNLEYHCLTLPYGKIILIGA